ncbi:MAG: hypothetical protein NTZ15_16560 [Burkholderiales bacterium]|nr:hypothetical protein [Burkholderiales bacterium]
MNTVLQFEYCVPESQKLADLYGVQHDLDEAIRYCDLHIEIDPTEPGISIEEILRREQTRHALCRAALFSYGRCFGGGVRVGLGLDLINRLPVELKDRHTQVKNLRDKWVAHSVNHFDDIRVRIDARLNSAGDIEVHGVSLASQLVGTFLRDWMIAYRALFVEVRALVQHELSVESLVLSNKVKEMPLQELMLLERVDGVPLTRKSWDPGQNRGRFKGN